MSRPGMPELVTDAAKKQMAAAQAAVESSYWTQEASKARQQVLRTTLRELLLLKACDALARMDEPHIDFKGKDAFQVTYPKAPAGAFKQYADAAATLLDKYRLEMGEDTSRVSVDIRNNIRRAAEIYGLDPDEVMAEAEQLLLESRNT